MQVKNKITWVSRCGPDACQADRLTPPVLSESSATTLEQEQNVVKETVWAKAILLVSVFHAA